MSEAIRTTTLKFLDVAAQKHLPEFVWRNARADVAIALSSEDLVLQLRSFVLAERLPDTHHEVSWWEYATPRDALLDMVVPRKWRHRFEFLEARKLRRTKTVTVKHHITFPHSRVFPERLGAPVLIHETA